jgi:hypothetical protein
MNQKANIGQIFVDFVLTLLRSDRISIHNDVLTLATPTQKKYEDVRHIRL